jgi:hypothetical protein
VAQKQEEKAETELRKLIAYPSLEDPVPPRTVFTHLGLARALALRLFERAQGSADAAAAFQLIET